MKIKKLRIFACPECHKKKFTSLMGLNNHLTKKHPEKRMKIDLTAQGRARSRGKSKSNVHKYT